MEYDIFFSWQSEKSSVSDFIRNQLSDCCIRLSEKHNVKMNLKDADADNRGSYNINTAVINGIENADIVVADLTPTSHGADGRANPNSNSLYEYAYACSKNGFENVVAITDISEDSTKNMPFDWNHNSLVTMNGLKDNHFGEQLERAIEKILLSKLKPVLHSATTVFFAKRISESFPGVRGVKIYEDPHEIKLHLETFFKHPIHFGEALDYEGDKTPIWWFRGGRAEGIDSFKVLKNGTYLIGWNEYKIKRIIVFSDASRYYSEYIYVETEPLTPIFPEEMTKNRIDFIIKSLGYCDEEYAIVDEGVIEKNIRREEYDDGHTEINGEIIPIRQRAKLRCRFLSPYNFVIAAKFSSINSNECDRKTHDLFDIILKDPSKFDKLHNIIISLPKPQYQGRQTR